MELFRITQEKYAEDLSGNGARIFGGRWNSEGKYALYTSATRALALLETLAHTPAKMLSSNTYLLITLFVPDKETIQTIYSDDLWAGWDNRDAPLFLKKTGDLFLTQNEKLILQVPSVLMPEESNYILNPLQEGMKKVKIVHKRRMVFDSRIQAK